MPNVSEIRDEYLRAWIKKYSSTKKTIVFWPRKTEMNTWLLPFSFAMCHTVCRPGMLSNEVKWYSEAEYTMLKLKGEI